MGWLIGVDVGGTFTDFFATERETNSVKYFKRPSTPKNPGEAIFLGLKEMCESLKIASDTIEQLCHGTTVATNALIQRKGGKVALVTTEGFRDLLEIGRQTRPHMYSLQEDQPESLVPRKYRFEVKERTNSDGTIIKEIDKNNLKVLFDEIEHSKVDSIAICFLFSFINNKPEELVAKLLKNRFPNIPISLSSEVRPEFREYERFSTTALNAYLQPIMGSYLDYLDNNIKLNIPNAPLRIYQSSGGLMSINTSKKFPIRTALSGPAAGAVGAVNIAKESNRSKVITLDMGGTSADVALVRDFDAGTSLDREVAGFPVRLPMVDIHTVGAGGGSISWVSKDGLMKVGPKSAGADPGPACYNLGGNEPTVTDANLVLGRLSGQGLIGGAMKLDLESARASIKKLADKFGFSIEKTAQGIIKIVISNMVRAVRAMSVERGHDPRDYSLMAFGGAGPLHGSQVAKSIDIKEIIVPLAPGILCAQGLIASDIKEDFIKSGRFHVNADWSINVREIMDSLSHEAKEWCKTERIEKKKQLYSVTLDARYVGQNFELQVTYKEAKSWEIPMPLDADEVIDRFNAAHEQLYGFANTDEQIEVVNIRLNVSGNFNEPSESNKKNTTIKSVNPISERLVWFDDEKPLKTNVFDRNDLKAGFEIEGPAIIEQFDSTTVIYPKDRVVIDKSLNIVISIS
tara:strand:- start:7280 stop:9337 length:2058 start_codon:yes stop_codon:yes gene_type:complete